MRILVAVDQKPYSAHAVHQVAGMASNTWADVTLLGVEPKRPSKAARPPTLVPDDPLPHTLRGYRESFLGHFKAEDSPYVQRKFGYELIEIRKGVWEELCVAKGAKKDLRARIRLGNPAKEILAEAREEQSDLIMLGCSQAEACKWEHGTDVPQKVVQDAACSVLVVKGEKKVSRIVCCLDHDRVSQQSLEMISQLVTLHQARLQIIGLTEGEGLRAEVEKKIEAIQRYYAGHKIVPWIEIVETSSLDSFIAQEARWGLMALWMGKKSILEKVFPRSKVGKLIRGSESSVLILR